MPCFQKQVRNREDEDELLGTGEREDIVGVFIP